MRAHNLAVSEVTENYKSIHRQLVFQLGVAFILYQVMQGTTNDLDWSDFDKVEAKSFLLKGIYENIFMRMITTTCCYVFFCSRPRKGVLEEYKEKTLARTLICDYIFLIYSYKLLVAEESISLR